MLASEGGHTRVLQLLDEKGADKELTTKVRLVCSDPVMSVIFSLVHSI